MGALQWHGDLHNVEHMEGKESKDFLKQIPNSTASGLES